MSRVASSEGFMPFGAIGGVPPCLWRPLKIDAVFGLRCQNYLFPLYDGTGPHSDGRGDGRTGLRSWMVRTLASTYVLRPRYGTRVSLISRGCLKTTEGDEIQEDR